MENSSLLQIEIENVKSWFSIAQGLLIVAGFLFTLSLATYNQTENNFSEIYSINSKLVPEWAGLYGSIISKNYSDNLSSLFLNTYLESYNQTLEGKGKHLLELINTTVIAGVIGVILAGLSAFSFL